MKKIYIFLFFTALLLGCNKSAKTQATATMDVQKVIVPVFVADSAYKYVKQQVDFGPRVPNTKAHVLCATYLAESLKSFGAEVTLQKATLSTFDGTRLNAVNIIGSYNVENENRILLFAHWDSRPWSDNDPDPTKHRQAVDGANDGASGVGVLLEMAR